MKHTTRNPLARGDRDRYPRRSNTFLGKEVSLVLKVKFRPFKEAREYTNYLNLKGQANWSEYCKSGTKPRGIMFSCKKSIQKKRYKLGRLVGQRNCFC